MIVVDTNIVAYLLIPGTHSTLARELFEKDPEWAAPRLWRSEFRNLLAGYLRRSLLTFEQVVAIQNEAEDLLFGNEHETDSLSVLELVRQSTCSAYDCEFVALAAQLDVPLYTMDAKLAKAFPSVASVLRATN
jgi:predicted nucleic acid-binding protein